MREHQLFSGNPRRIGHVRPGRPLEVDDREVYIEFVGPEAEVRFVNWETVAVIGCGVGHHARVCFEGGSARVEVGRPQGLAHHSYFRMGQGDLVVKGPMRRHATLVTRGEYEILGRQSSSARIMRYETIEDITDPAIIAEIDSSRAQMDRTRLPILPIDMRLHLGLDDPRDPRP
jgi:hypothetical protein